MSFEIYYLQIILEFDVICSFYRLITRPDKLIGRNYYLLAKYQSFGDYLISESVSVTPSSVIEASAVLCSMSL
jgi:hypothetical protein